MMIKHQCPLLTLSRHCQRLLWGEYRTLIRTANGLEIDVDIGCRFSDGLNNAAKYSSTVFATEPYFIDIIRLFRRLDRQLTRP